MKKLAPLVAVLMLVSPAQAAIDTLNKRSSSLTYPVSTPDGSLADAGDRAQSLRMYRGLFDGAGGSSTGGTTGGGAFWIIRSKRR